MRYFIICFIAEISVEFFFKLVAKVMVFVLESLIRDMHVFQ